MTAERAVAQWSLMQQVRPAIMAALRAWGDRRGAAALDAAASPAALRAVAGDVEKALQRRVLFGPPRRDLVRSLRAVQAAGALFSRAQYESALTMAMAALLGASSALDWRRPWRRRGWRRREAALIMQARAAQIEYRADHGLNKDSRSAATTSGAMP